MTRSRIFLGAFLLTAWAASGSTEPQRRPGAPAAPRRGRSPVPVEADEKTGPIEIKIARMQQGNSGVYVASGGSYNLKTGTPTEFQVEWKTEKPLSEAPLLTIEWGFTESTSTSCGLCRLSKTVPEGSHSITIRMDDRKGGVTKRVFVVNATKK